jgi:predicted nucleic acid-binding Zn ribbon protein
MTPAGAAPVPTVDAVLACGNCRATMRRVALGGHYGAIVELDICESCDLVWFDGTETARLSGLGMLDLIGRMAQAYDLPYEPLRPETTCPRCAGKLALVHNQSRWGQSVQLQCVRRHGAYQSFAEFLEEKGLLRPMSRVDRARLLRDKGRIDCVNCGAAVGLDDQRCPFCHSIPSLLDVARLARALDPEEMLAHQTLPGLQTKQEAMQCAACGAALPPGETMSCAQCGATLAIPSLREANAAVQALAPALRANAEHPPAEVIKRRLDFIEADLPRRREWAAGMEREARQERGHVDDDFEWSSLLSPGTNPVRAVLIALAVWFLWSLWHRG